MVPRVSVCIPTFNGAAFLAETVASAVAQTFDDFEVVIVDDCSTDESFDIAERFARSDPRVRAIRNAERAGSGAANAKAYLAHARGEWIKTLNQDDLMAPTCLARMLDASARGPLVICWHDYLFETGVDPDVRAWYEQNSDPCQRAARRLRRRRRRLRGRAPAADRPTSSGRRARDSSIAIVSRSTARSIPRFRSSPTSTSGLASAPVRASLSRPSPCSPSACTTRRSAPRYGVIHAVPFAPTFNSCAARLQFARAPGFENIRRVAAALSPAVDLEGQLRTSASEMRWGAIETRYRARDPWPLAQWDAFVAAEPEMQKAAARDRRRAPLLGSRASVHQAQTLSATRSASHGAIEYFPVSTEM